MSEHFIGQWAVIDIETTGVNPGSDEIIDVGFLKFDGLELIETYSSLVRYEYELPHFIKKLTGISEKQLKLAPKAKDVFNKLEELDQYVLMAHNASFEESFLETIIGDVEYVDSLFYLPILFPEISNLKLESWLIEFGLAEVERHRGLEDSIDLLKIVLFTTYLCKRSKIENNLKETLWKKYLNNSFWQKFYSLEVDELEHIASQIDFNLFEAFESLKSSHLEKSNKSFNSSNMNLGFDGKSIEILLTNEEYLKQFLPGYKTRTQQLEMSKRVGQTFKHNVHSLIEAPTGTGKTLGYLIPSILCSKENSEQILIATATKTLQKQIVDKDLPLAEGIFHDYDEINCVKLIGTSNHFCELAFRNKTEEQNMFESTDEAWANLYFENLFNYNKLATEQLTVENLQYVLLKKSDAFKLLKEEIQVDYRTCIGKNCPYKIDCSYLKGISDAKSADIIVANHALLFSWPNSLPLPQKLIVDEAHKIEHSITSSYTQEFYMKDFDYFIQNLTGGRRLGSLKYLIKAFNIEVGEDFEKNLVDFAERINDHYKFLGEKIEIYFKSRNRYTDLYWNEAEFETNKKIINSKLELEICNSIDSLNFIFTTIEKYFEKFASIKDQIDFKDEEKVTAWNNAEFLLSKVADTSLFFNNLMNGDNDYVHTISFHQSQGAKLNIFPIDCGKLIRENLLNKISASVFTSATIGIGQNLKAPLGIQWATGQLYLDGTKRFNTDLSLPPYFDYKQKAKVFICSDTPSLNSIDFIPEVLSKVSEVIKKINGKSLLLFSSKVRFNKACEYLIGYLSDEFPLFIQGMGANVVDEFKNCSNGILIGLESFGEGIDIPGKQLQFVFIDKIPDIRQDLIIKKRREFFQTHFGNEFENYFMASRERSLLQKFGRLLRNTDDFGGIIVVDSRISRWKSHTLNRFFNNLYPYQIEKKTLEIACNELGEFINSFRDHV